MLNYDGVALLRECLPTVIEAARRCSVPCPVTVIDNGSRDDSVALIRREWPEVEIVEEPNRGLASFNAVLRRIDEPTALLLNNDIKLDPDAVNPLLAAIEANDDALFAAPQCWTFDGREYEGMRTRVRTRFGMVQGMSRVPGHEACVDRSDLTAAAGPVLAVDRVKFLALGGYDPLYFPGRIEDLDLGFRGWMAGWTGLYVPESRSWHRGFGSFGPAFGAKGCDRLATRNTLLFAWKNLSGARLAGHLLWLPPRVAVALATRRTNFLLALAGALARLGAVAEARRVEMAAGDPGRVVRQEAFFERFSW